MLRRRLAASPDDVSGETPVPMVTTGSVLPQVKIGLFLSAQLEPGADPAAEVERLVEQATLAETLGFSSIFLGHHYLARSQFLQPLSVVNHLAALTTDIRLGFGVYLLPLHNPLALAEELASTDVLSNGRLIVGVGAGYREVEYAAFGVPYAERFKRLEESVAVMKRLWAGERVSIDGYFGSLDQAEVLLRPLQSGGPPIWMGAFGPAGIRRAVRLNASWLAPPDGDRGILAERYTLYRSALEEQGHGDGIEYPLMREAVVAGSREAALAVAGEYLVKQYAQYKSWSAAQAVDTEQLLNEFALVGTPESVAETLAWYRDELGITEVILRLQWVGMDHSAVIDSLRIIGEELIGAVSA